MRIELPPEIEAIAERAVRQGAAASVAELVADAVRQAAGVNGRIDATETEDQRVQMDVRYRRWKERFEAFLAGRTPTNADFDDSRSAIYSDR